MARWGDFLDRVQSDFDVSLGLREGEIRGIRNSVNGKVEI